MNHILLFGMPGGGELFIIVLVIIMLFGSKKIPELARGLGKGMREIKNATDDIQREIREGAKEMNIPENPLNIKKQVTDLIMKETPSQEEKKNENPPSKDETVGQTKQDEVAKPIQRNTSIPKEHIDTPKESKNPSENS